LLRKSLCFSRSAIPSRFSLHFFHYPIFASLNEKGLYQDNRPVFRLQRSPPSTVGPPPSLPPSFLLECSRNERRITSFFFLGLSSLSGSISFFSVVCPVFLNNPSDVIPIRLQVSSSPLAVRTSGTAAYFTLPAADKGGFESRFPLNLPVVTFIS